MFHSISKCQPSSVVTTSYTANTPHVLTVDSGTSISVNGNIVPGTTFSIGISDVVTASVQAPEQHLAHSFYNYSIGASSFSFAVATKSKFNNSLKQEDSHKRWWDYLLGDKHLISFKNSAGDLQNARTLGYNTSQQLALDTYTICDQQTKKVYFFTALGLLIDAVEFTTAPIQCEPFGEFYVVSCDDGSIHKLTVDHASLSNTLANQQQSTPRQDWLYELHFETDIPLQGTILRINQQKILEGSGSEAKCLSAGNALIWIGGYRRAWVLNQQLVVVAEVELPDLATGIQQLGERAIAVTRSGLIYVIEHTVGSSILSKTRIFSGGWLGNPCVFANNVYVSSSEAGQVLKFDLSNFSYQQLELTDFSPSYLSTDGSKLYICGHDSSIVKIYDGASFVDAQFTDKVTFAQAKNGALLVSHKLKSINVLDHSLMKEVLLQQPAKIKTTLTVAGCSPQKISVLSKNTVNILAPTSVAVWVNGRYASQAQDGDYVSFSQTFNSLGTFSSPIIIGDCAIDFVAEAVTETFSEGRNVEFSPTPSATEVQYDFIVTEPVATVSVDYGQVLKNFLPNDNEPWKTGDVASIVIPGATSGVISTLSIGKQHFYLPVLQVPGNLHTETVNNVYSSSQASYDYTVQIPGEYFFPVTFNTDISKVKSFLGNTFTALGGQFDALHPIENLYLSGKDVYNNFAYIDVVQGPFDVYVDLVQPQVVTAFLISPRFQNEQIPDTDPPQFTIKTKDAPQQFNIHASNDAQTWTVVSTFNVTEAQWLLDISATSEFAFTNSTAYRYWRLEVTQDNGEAVAITAWNCKVLTKESSIKVNSIIVNPGTKQLQLGDLISFSAATSQFLFDIRTLAITGPTTVIFTTRTNSLPFLASPIFLGHITELLSRTTLRTEITLANLQSPITIFSDSQQMVWVNGELAGNSVVCNNGDVLTIQKQVNGIFEDRASVYIYQSDASSGRSDVKVELAYWTLNSELPSSVSHKTSNTTNINSIEYVGFNEKQGLIDALEFLKYQSPIVPISNRFTFTKKMSDTLASYDAYGWSYSAFSTLTSQHFATINSSDSLLTSLKFGQQFAPTETYVSSIYDYARFTYSLYTETCNTFNLTQLHESAFNTFDFNLTHSAPAFSDGLGQQQMILDREDVILRVVQKFNSASWHEKSASSTKFVSIPTFTNDQKDATKFLTKLHPAYFELIVSPFTTNRISHIDVNANAFTVALQQLPLVIKPAFITIYDTLPVLRNITPDYVLNLDLLHIKQSNQVTANVEPLHVKLGNQVVHNLEPLHVKQGNSVVIDFDPIKIYSSFNVNLDIEPLLVNDIDGEFATAAEAEAAATSKGHLPFIVMYIPDTNVFTYRKLSITSKICTALPPGTIVAVSGLIQGG